MDSVRLIDANALIKHYSCVEAQKSSVEKIRAEIIIQALENAPTIDPKRLQPVGRDDRKKLIKLIQSAVDGCAEYWAGLIADNLITNGVTFATDNNDGGKWTRVEMPPKKEGRYLVYDEVTGNYFDAFFDEGCQEFGEWVPYFNPDTLGLEDHEWREYCSITHWKPLPELPEVE